MRAKAIILLSLGFFLIIGTVAASMAVSSVSSITTSKQWVVANNADMSEIRVIAKNTSVIPVPSATVTFTIDNPAYGLMTSPTVKTDTFGMAKSNFVSKTRSGTAVITATILSDDGGSPHTTVLIITQKIDHDLAQNAVFDNPPAMTVGSVSNLTITLKDRWGNLIDNNNTAEQHAIKLSMPGGAGRGLWDGSYFVPMIPVNGTDAFGNASATFRISTVSGPINQIYMDPVGNMVTAPQSWIEGIAEGDPAYISETFPSPGALAADGFAMFGFTYTVYDRYLNPVNNTAVLINASDGTSAIRNTNALGTVFTTFGPKDIIGLYTITATPLANTSGSAVCRETGELKNCSQVVEFYNTGPVDLMVMANPQGMASLDVDPASAGTVMARVVDIRGNPVLGQTVFFSMATPTYPGGPYHVTTDPTLSAASAVTGAGGFATVTFRPGGFAGYNLSDPLYNATATGVVVVTASWTNLSGSVINRDVTFVWKNYPYLGVNVPSDICKAVAVGNTINVTIRVSGDGAALRPKPVNAILVMDSSGSMAGGMNGPDGARTKIWYSNSSGHAFVDQMNSATDQIGLVTYSTNAAYPVAISTNFAAVKSGLTSMVASGTTNQRMATHLALTNMIALGADPYKTVQALVVMTDGQYNQDGDPLARLLAYQRTIEGNWGDGSSYWYIIPALGAATDSRQNLSLYALDNKIKIYTVTFGTDAAIQNGTPLFKLMTDIAEITGGKHYHAVDGSQALDVYRKIAGDLKETAGGNTTTVIDNNQIKVDGVMGGGDILNYTSYIADVHVPAQPTDSTYIIKSHVYSNGTEVIYPGFPVSQDDTAQWNSRNIVMTPGDINLNDIWSATFRLNLTRAGKIELFGPDSNSSVCFTDVSTDRTTCQFIPALQCNIQEHLVNQAFGNKNLSLDHLTNSMNQDIQTLTWNTTYDGSMMVQETVSYRNDDISNSRFHTVIGGISYLPACINRTSSLTFDTSGWPSGHYTFRVSAVAADAATSPTVEITWFKGDPDGTRYINLE